MDNLEEIRKQIDDVDAQIAPLFERRMDLVDKIAAYKQAQGMPVLAAVREADWRMGLPHAVLALSVLGLGLYAHPVVEAAARIAGLL